MALLSDYVSHANITMRIGAIFGLGLAYAGSDRQDLVQLLLPVFADAKVSSNMEVVGVTALALGLISVSNPQLNILDTLSKFSHDADAEVAHNSIFAMGLLGAGTNNARLAALLRQVRLETPFFGS